MGLAGANGTAGTAGAQGIQGLTGATGATGPAPDTSLFAPIANPTFTGMTALGTVDQIMFSNAYSAPTLTSRAPGNKLILYPSLTASELDYAIGVETSDMFFSTENSGAGYKFYTGSSVATSISGGGDLATIGAITSASSSTAGNATVGGNLTVTGNVTINGSLSGYSPYWAACKIDGSVASAVPTILKRKGDKGSEITCVRKSGQAVGVYEITWTTPHPDGANLICMVSGEGASYSETLGAGTAGWTNTSTQITCIFRKLYSVGTEALVDCPFTFFVLK